MANTKEIQKRMKSIRDTMKITSVYDILCQTAQRQAEA